MNMFVDRKASKKERRALYGLYFEYATLPILILSVTVLFDTDWDAVSTSLLGSDSIAAHMCVVAIPFSALSYIFTKVLLVYRPNIKELPNFLSRTDEFGASFGLGGFGVYLFSKAPSLAILFAASIFIAFGLIYSSAKSMNDSDGK